MSGLKYIHVDVFTSLPFSGNSLPVFVDAGDVSSAAMLRITQELRHFKSIFLSPTDDKQTFLTRVFDLFEELPFAGHPLLGAAAALHHRSGGDELQTWQFVLRGRWVQ